MRSRARVCVIGRPCAKHGDVVHGREAEELRAGVEQILGNTADVREDAAIHVLREMRRALLFLLDHTDARDSLAFQEALDSKLKAVAARPAGGDDHPGDNVQCATAGPEVCREEEDNDASE